MFDFKQRSTQLELLDQGEISFEEFHHCLRDLEIINMLTLAYRPTLRWLRQVMKAGPACILDAGSGGGDMLNRIESLAGVNRAKIRLIGVDLNPWSKQSAQLSSPDSRVQYETADILSYDPQEPVDVVICSLFTHHLNDDELVQFLRWMNHRAAMGWFINDLHRHPLPYYFIKAATALFSRNRLIRHDAALSVARSFSKKDWKMFLERAEISGQAQVKWVFPFRLCVSCLKS